MLIVSNDKIINFDKIVAVEVSSNFLFLHFQNGRIDVNFTATDYAKKAKEKIIDAFKHDEKTISI